MRMRRLAKVFAGTVIGVPTIGGLGLGCYVLFRVKTQPPEHDFKTLVHEDGTLTMNEGKIAPPTRWKITIRVLHLIWIFLPCFIAFWFMKWTDTLFHHWSLMMLRAVERAGPAFTKLGQWAVTRSDLFPKELREVFERLYSGVSVHPFKESLRLIEKELGRPPNEVFDDIEPEALGSGSIGQVHRATLKATGEKVVIKVMHPNVVEDISRDFYIINAIARYVHRKAKSLEYLNIQAVTMDWTCHLAAQLDFRLEQEHLQLFRKHFADVDYVIFPKPHFATEKMLVEGWVPGVPATPRFLASLPSHARSILAAKGLNTFMKMMLRDNFVHGDMHPGNILVDASDPHHPKCYMIDVGLCQKLTNEEGHNMNEFTAAFVHWDHHQAVRAMTSMGTQDHITSMEQFTKDMEYLFDHYRPVQDSDDAVIANILQSCFECVRQNRVTLGPSYVSQLWSCLVLEGFINALDPNFNMVRHCAPWLVSEGHFSWGLIKNVIKANVDKVVETALVYEGRIKDKIAPKRMTA